MTQKLVKYKKPPALLSLRSMADSSESAIVVARSGAVRVKSPFLSYLTTLAEGASRRTMEGAVSKVARILVSTQEFHGVDPNPATFPWHELDYELVNGLRGHIAETHKKSLASANLLVAAVRGVLKQCARLKLMSHDDMEAALSGARVIKGHREVAGRVLEEGEIWKLWGACDPPDTPLGARDRAMLMLLHWYGLRRAEVSKLDLSNLIGHKTIRFVGKGNKERSAHLQSKADAETLGNWLLVRGDWAGPLICSCSRSNVLRRRFSDDSIHGRLQALADRAGLEHVTPHDLRRTFATNHLDDGTDVIVVSKLMGHSRIETTARYDRRSEKAQIDAMEKFRSKRSRP